MAPLVQVREKGLRETRAALRAMGEDLPRELNRELVQLGKPISEDARSRVERYGSAVANKIRPRVKSGSLFVESRARSKGLHPNLGSLVAASLWDAASSHIDEVVIGFERVIDRVAGRNGFK